MFPITQEQVDKARFVHCMGPYYLQAKSEEMEEEFFAAVFTHYCDRWPVDISGYQGTNSWNLAESIKMSADMEMYQADRHWMDLFKHKNSSDQHGPCVQLVVNTAALDDANRQSEGLTSGHCVAVGTPQGDSPDIGLAIRFRPTPASALPPRPRPRLRRRLEDFPHNAKDNEYGGGR